MHHNTFAHADMKIVILFIKRVSFITKQNTSDIKFFFHSREQLWQNLKSIIWRNNLKTSQFVHRRKLWAHIMRNLNLKAMTVKTSEIHALSITDPVKLHHSAVPWKPTNQLVAAGTGVIGASRSSLMSRSAPPYRSYPQTMTKAHQAFKVPHRLTSKVWVLNHAVKSIHKT